MSRETKLPGIGNVPKGLPPALEKFLSAIKEVVEVRLGGVRGDPLDVAVTRRELVKSGVATIDAANRLGAPSTGGVGGGGGGGGDTVGGTDPTPTPTEPGTSAVVLSVSPSAPKVGATVTMTATVAGSSPTGSVVFKDAGSPLQTVALVNGAASYATTGLGRGVHPLTADYGGDDNNRAATSNTVLLEVGSDWSGPPPAPTSLNAFGDNFQIVLHWVNPYIGDYAATEVWGSTTNDRSTAVKLGEIAGNAWVFSELGGAPLVGGTTWYFWVRNKDTEEPEQFSTYYPATTTGVAATVSNSPSKYLTLLTNAITRSQLWDGLGGIIDNVANQQVWKIDDDGWYSGIGLASQHVNGVPYSDVLIRANRIAFGNPSAPADKKTISSLTRSGTVATCVTTSNHTLVVNEWAVIQNVAENGWNGIVKVTSVPTPSSFTFTVPDTISATTTVKSGQPARYAFRRADELPLSSLTRSGTTGTATTAVPHGLTSADVGRWVSFLNASDALWNGSFKVTAVPNTTQIQFIAPTTLPTSAAPAAGEALMLNKANVPLVILTTPTTIGSVTIPAGVFINGLSVMEASIEWAAIRNVVVTNAQIGNVINSTTWDASGGTTGWRIDKAGNITVKGGTIDVWDALGNPVLVAGSLNRIFGNPNMLKNAGFESYRDNAGPPAPYQPAYWQLVQGASHASTAGCVQDARNGVGSSWLLGDGTAFIYQPNAVATGYDFLETVEYMPVEEGKWYEGSVYTGAHRCTVGAQIVWYNSAKTQIGVAYSDLNASEKAGGTVLSGFKRLFVLAQAPAGAAYCKFSGYKSGTTSGADSYAFFARAKLALAISSTQTEPTPWTRDTAPSWISAGNISTFFEAAAITSAYIKDAEISTLKLAGQAVTFEQVASGSATLNNSSFVDVCSLVFPPAATATDRGKMRVDASIEVHVPEADNYRVQVQVIADYSSNGSSWTLLASSPLWQDKLFALTSGQGSYIATRTFFFVEPLHETYWNYYIRYRLSVKTVNAGSNIALQTGRLLCRETKR